MNEVGKGETRGKAQKNGSHLTTLDGMPALKRDEPRGPSR